MKAKLKQWGLLLFLVLLSSVVWIPLIFMFGGSLMGILELKETLGPVFLGTEGYATWSLLPRFPTLRPYVELLLDSPSFFVQFWNSIAISFFSVMGQLLLAAPAAWWFARSKSKFSRGLFSLYIILMLMPFQVTMVSNYLVIDRLGLLDHLASLILPAIFSTFPVFILFRFFHNIPETTIEAANIDGANQWQVFFHIGIPIGKAGLMTTLVLAFLDAWNLVEQPMIFLKNKRLWPLSLYLPEITASNMGIALAASVVSLLPAVLVFLFGQEYLEEGIAHTGAKG